MKFSLIALCSITMLSACTSSMRVTHTEVATGAANPRAIYIRPFSVEHAEFRDGNNPNSLAIRKSQAPIAFAEVLSEELSQIAPTRILKEDEDAPTGWLVEGNFDTIDAGLAGTGDKGKFKVHVRVTEVGKRAYRSADSKTGNVSRGYNTRNGRVIYAFDVEGHSNYSTSQWNPMKSEQVGSSLQRDYRNAAERIMIALSIDPFRYGERDSPLARN